MVRGAQMMDGRRVSDEELFCVVAWACLWFVVGLAAGAFLL